MGDPGIPRCTAWSVALGRPAFKFPLSFEALWMALGRLEYQSLSLSSYLGFSVVSSHPSLKELTVAYVGFSSLLFSKQFCGIGYTEREWLVPGYPVGLMSNRTLNSGFCSPVLRPLHCTDSQVGKVIVKRK